MAKTCDCGCWSDTVATLTTPSGRSVQFPQRVVIEDDSTGGDEASVDTAKLVERLRRSARCVELACAYAGRFDLSEVTCVSHEPPRRDKDTPPRRFTNFLLKELDMWIEDEDVLPVVLLIALLQQRPVRTDRPALRVIAGGKRAL